MSTPAPLPAIRATGLTKSFRLPDGSTVTAVDAVDLTVAPGEIVAFLGPNGAGKTTTVDMLLGLTTPTGGTVEVYGEAPGRAVAAGRVSAVMQTGGLLPDFTVLETVQAIAVLHGRRDRVDEVVERAGLAPARRRRVQGVLRRRAAASASSPWPWSPTRTSSCSTSRPPAWTSEARQSFWEAMRADAASGRTIVFATHYLAEADEFAARTVLMKGGRIVEDGPTADVRAAFGGRTVSFRPPADVVHRDGVDPAWLARVGQALAPLGVTGVDVSSASLEAAFLALTGGRRPHPDPAHLDRTDLAGAPR